MAEPVPHPQRRPASGRDRGPGTVPTAATAGAWLAFALVVLPIPAAVVVSLGEPGSLVSVVGFVGGWLILLGALLALVFGVIGLVQSLLARSVSGLALSAAPVAVVGLGLFLVLGG